MTVGHNIIVTYSYKNNYYVECSKPTMLTNTVCNSADHFKGIVSSLNDFSMELYKW